MEAPKGKPRLTEAERAIIREYRSKRYSISQIAQFMQRSTSSIKRVIYEW